MSILKALKGKGTVKNYSSKTIWIVETNTIIRGYSAVAHKLKPNYRVPNVIDCDGFKRLDGKAIRNHKFWWKLLNYITIRIYDYGKDDLWVTGLCFSVSDSEFE